MIRGLLALLSVLLLPSLAQAQEEARLPNRCECADCFAFMQRRSEMATRLHEQGLAEMLLIRQNAPLVYQGDNIWTPPDEATITTAQRGLVPGVREAIGDGLAALDPLAPQCRIGLQGDMWGSFIHVSSATCTIPDRERLSIQLAVPCPEMYLAVLVHEISHVADCIARPRGVPFTPEELMASEIKAAQAEQDVLTLLRHRRLEECRRRSVPLTTPMHHDWETALRFLDEARQYAAESALGGDEL